VGTKTKDILLRVPPDKADALAQAQWDERQTATGALLQALDIWLYLVQHGQLDSALRKVGYQERNRPGRPRKAPAGVNGQRSPGGPAGILPGPADAAGDGWDLDGDASDA
jgi:hypothetical protein